MKSLSLAVIATLLFSTSSAAVAAAHPGSVYERPVAVSVDQNDTHPAYQQEQRLPVELTPPAAKPTATRPCARPTTTAVAGDESQNDNPIQQSPIVSTRPAVTATATVTSAVTSSALPTALTSTTTTTAIPVPTKAAGKRKCIRWRTKPAALPTTSVIDIGYGGKPGKTAVATASALPTNVFEKPAPTEEPVSKNNLAEASSGMATKVGGAAVVVMVLGAGLVL